MERRYEVIQKIEPGEVRETRIWFQPGKYEILELTQWIIENDEEEAQYARSEGLVRFWYQENGTLIAWSGQHIHFDIERLYCIDGNRALSGYLDLYREDGEWTKRWRLNGRCQEGAADLVESLEVYLTSIISGGMIQGRYRDF